MNAREELSQAHRVWLEATRTYDALVWKVLEGGQASEEELLNAAQVMTTAHDIMVLQAKPFLLQTPVSAKL